MLAAIGDDYPAIMAWLLISLDDTPIIASVGLTINLNNAVTLGSADTLNDFVGHALSPQHPTKKLQPGHHPASYATINLR